MQLTPNKKVPKIFEFKRDVHLEQREMSKILNSNLESDFKMWKGFRQKQIESPKIQFVRTSTFPSTNAKIKSSIISQKHYTKSEMLLDARRRVHQDISVLPRTDISPASLLYLRLDMIRIWHRIMLIALFWVLKAISILAGVSPKKHLRAMVIIAQTLWCLNKLEIIWK